MTPKRYLLYVDLLTRWDRLPANSHPLARVTRRQERCNGSKRSLETSAEYRARYRANLYARRDAIVEALKACL
jgi:hypothetical protein